MYQQQDNTIHYVVTQSQKELTSKLEWQYFGNHSRFVLTSPDIQIIQAKILLINAVLQHYTPKKGGNDPFTGQMNIEYFIFE